MHPFAHLCSSREQPYNNAHVKVIMKQITAILVLLIVGSSVSAQYRNVYKESAWEDRDKWQKPGMILKAMSFDKGDRVADVGSHQGYMTVKLAEAVGEEGKVYAVDIDKNQLRNLEDNLRKRSLLDRVEAIHADPDNPKLPGNTLDAVIIMDTYHEIEDYKEVLRHIKEALKPGGRLVIIEPIADDRKSWSRRRQAEKHEIAIRYVVKDLRDAGFNLLQDDTEFVDRREVKGDAMWMLVAEK